jgi:Arc/MetJ family transcription regulator
MVRTDDPLMKTTVDIPEEVLREAMRNTNASSEREAIVKAIEEFNRKERLSRLADELGKSDTFMTLDELLEMREAEKIRGHE